jgi:RNA polymerase sigma-70 factor (ECF subfamily)
VKDDSLLIEEALSGDGASFGQLVRRYQDRLFNTLVHVLGCHDEAEDVAQDAFVQAYTKLSSFKGQSAFYTWLYRIAFNMLVSRRRRNRVHISIESAQHMTGGPGTTAA